MDAARASPATPGWWGIPVNNRERAERMIAHLTMAYESAQGIRIGAGIGTFEPNDFGSVTLPIDGLTPERAAVVGLNAGLEEGLKLVDVLTDLTCALGSLLESRAPDVDFQDLIRDLAMWVAVMPNPEGE